MNILIVPSWFETDSNHIRGSFFKEQALALQKAGHNVKIAYVYLRTMRESFSKSIYRIEQKVEGGVQIYIYNVPSMGSIRRGTWFDKNVKCYRKLLKYVLNKEQIDLVHVHSFVPAGYAMAYLKKEFGIPLVYTEHFSAVIADKLNEQQREKFEFTINNVDKVIAVSDALGNAMKKSGNFNGEICTIPNILSPLFTYKTHKNSKVFRFVSVGGLIPRKRCDITIKAFHKAFPNNENVRLEIIGEGVERENLENLLNELKEKRVVLTGRKKREEVADIMRESDAFVLSSAVETFGVVYIEAMASGLPVIGTKNGGFDEIYTKDCGYLKEVDDLVGISESMKKIYNNVDHFDGEKISKNCIAKYGEASIVKSLVECYESVLQERKEIVNE